MSGTGTVVRKSVVRRAKEAFWDWLRAPTKRAPSDRDRSWIVALLPLLLVAITLLCLMSAFGMI